MDARTVECQKWDQTWKVAEELSEKERGYGVKQSKFQLSALNHLLAELPWISYFSSEPQFLAG